MKIIHQPTDMARTVRFSSMTKQILHGASIALAARAQSNRAAIPDYTASFRVLDLVLDAIEKTNATNTTVSAKALLDAVSEVGRSMVTLTRAFMTYAAQEKTKLLQGWFPREVVADAFGAIIQANSGKIGALSQTGAYDLLLFAVPGTAQERTQESTANVIMRLAGLAAIVESASGTALELAELRLTTANLMDWGREMVDTRVTADPSTIGVGKPDEAFALRLGELQRLTHAVLGAPAAGAVSCARHHLRFLKDPWVIAATTGREAAELMKVVEEFEQRTLSTGIYGEHVALQKTDAYDQDIIVLPNFSAAANRVRSTTLPEVADEFLAPLAEDFAFNLYISDNDIAVWMANAWALNKKAETLASELERFAPVVGNHVNPAPSDAEFTAETGIAGLSHANGYPLLSPANATQPWATSRWATRALKLDHWAMHTRVHVLELMAQNPYLPVRVTGPAAASPLGRLPSVLPVFEKFDDMAPMLTMSREALAFAWNQPEDSFAARLQARAQTGATAFPMRILAEALRHVGILRLEDTAVEPFTRHWYHGRKFHASVFGPTIALSGSAKGSTAIELLPFKYVPQSAQLARMPSKLTRIHLTQYDSAVPAVRWIELEEVQPSPVEIRGWTTSQESILDILLLAITSEARDYYLTGTETGAPLAGRGFNAVMSVREPPPPANVPSVAIQAGTYEIIP